MKVKALMKALEHLAEHATTDCQSAEAAAVVQAAHDAAHDEVCAIVGLAKMLVKNNDEGGVSADWQDKAWDDLRELAKETP